MNLAQFMQERLQDANFLNEISNMIGNILGNPKEEAPSTGEKDEIVPFVAFLEKCREILFAYEDGATDSVAMLSKLVLFLSAHERTIPGSCVFKSADTYRPLFMSCLNQTSSNVFVKRSARIDMVAETGSFSAMKLPSFMNLSFDGYVACGMAMTEVYFRSRNIMRTVLKKRGLEIYFLSDDCESEVSSHSLSARLFSVLKELKELNLCERMVIGKDKVVVKPSPGVVYAELMPESITVYLSVFKNLGEVVKNQPLHIAQCAFDGTDFYFSNAFLFSWMAKLSVFDTTATDNITKYSNTTLPIVIPGRPVRAELSSHEFLLLRNKR